MSRRLPFGPKLKRWLAPLVLAMLLAAVPMAASSSVAQAASGGGCGPATTLRWASFKACISAPFYGVGQPDAYVTLAPGHPPCNIEIVAYQDTGAVVSDKVYPCPSSANNAHYNGNSFLGTGTYFTVVYVGGFSSPASPNLRLP